MVDVVQKEISFPIIPVSVDPELEAYLLRIEEILREVSLGESHFTSVALQEFSADGAGFKDEDDMASDSDKAASSQQAIKAHVAAAIAGLSFDEYTDRGDPAAADFDQDDLTMDNTWNDLDLSGKGGMGTGVKLVLLSVYVVDDAASTRILFRENGNSNASNSDGIRSQVANVANSGHVWVLTDGDGVIEYISTAAIGTINITICGWFS